MKFLYFTLSFTVIIVVTVIIVFVYLRKPHAIDALRSAAAKTTSQNYTAIYQHISKTRAKNQELNIETRIAVTKKDDKIKSETFLKNFRIESRIQNDLGFFVCNFLDTPLKPDCTRLYEKDAKVVVFDTMNVYKEWSKRGIVKIKQSEDSVKVWNTDRPCALFEFTLDSARLTSKDMSVFSQLINQEITDYDRAQAVDLLKQMIKESKSSFCLDTETGIILKSTSYNKLHEEEDNYDIEKETEITITDLGINPIIPDEDFDLPRAIGFSLFDVL